MKGETGERWKILCAQAAEEQDSEKLLELVKQINKASGRKRGAAEKAGSAEEDGRYSVFMSRFQ